MQYAGPFFIQYVVRFGYVALYWIAWIPDAPYDIMKLILYLNAHAQT